MRVVLLRGRDHPALRAVDTVAEDDTAVALSRGGAAKTYAYVHPNEDAALFARGARGTLVAVADGHWGSEAAEAALECLREAVAEAWTESAAPEPGGWERAAERAVEAVSAAVLDLRHIEGKRSPRSTLAFALARPDEDLLVTASVGDSHLFRAGTDGRVEDLADGPRRSRYLGARARDGRPLPPEAWIRVIPLGGTRALLAVTDGLSEPGIGVEDPAVTVAEAVERATKARAPLQARAAARAVLEAALAAHRAHDAGDNVSAAVAWIEGVRPDPSLPQS